MLNNTENRDETVADQINDRIEGERAEQFAETADEMEEKPKRAKKFLIAALALVIILGGIGWLFVRRQNTARTVELPPAQVQQNADTTQLAENLYPAVTPTPLPTPDTFQIGVTNPETTYGTNSSSPGNFSPVTIPQQNPNPQTQSNSQPVTQIPIPDANNQNQTGGDGNRSYSGSSTSSSRGGSQAQGSSIIPKSTPIRSTAETVAQTGAYIFRSNNKNLTASGVPVADKTGGISYLKTSTNIPFGTLLPVRTLGAVHSLISGSLARLELTRDVRGNGWYLPAGTIIVARQQQGIGDRLSLVPQGFILGERFYALQGEISAKDGGIGLKGERKSIGSKWYRTVIDLASRAQQSLNAWLSSRGGGNYTNVEYPSVADVSSVNQNAQVIRYVAVPAMTEGWLLVTQLPDRSNEPLPFEKVEKRVDENKIEEINNAIGSGDISQIEKFPKE